MEQSKQKPNKRKQSKMERLMPKDELPYEKYRAKGEGTLSNQELLAILLRTGTPRENALALAGRLLYGQPGRKGLKGLCSLSREELLAIHGIGEVKAMQLRCICELSRRLAKESAGPAAVFDSPEAIAGYYMEDMRHKGQEELVLLLLNGRNHRIGEKVISIGTVNGAMITPREIFLEALRFQAVNIVLLHNHPSGDPTPSEEDILLTRRVLRAGELLGVTLLDHIVIGDCRYISLKERGILSL